MQGRLLIACALTIAASSASAQLPNIGLGFVEVGDPGNPAYQSTARHTLGFVGRGSVDYRYSITRSQITSGDWFEFFDNFSDVSDELHATLRPVGFSALRDPFYFGPGERYSFDLVNRPFAPLDPLSLRRTQALMYANWLHNGKSDRVEDLYDGAYTFDPVTGEAPDVHNTDARFRLPTLDEYMKAVHYSPFGDNGGPKWYAHRLGSDEVPTTGLPSEADTPWDPTIPSSVWDTIWNGVIGPSNVPLGEYAHATTYYGLMDTYAGLGEFLGVREPVFALDFQDDIRTWYFESGRNDFEDLTFPIYSGNGDSLGGFRIVTTIPSPGAVFPLAATFAAVRRRR